MKVKSLRILKERNVLEIVISLLSILAGVFVIYQSIYLVYAYHFGKALFLIMYPMTNLISELIIGLFLTFSGFFLLTNNKKQTFFYKLTGVLLMIFPLNEILLENMSSLDLMKLFVIFTFGLLLYLFMGQKKYRIHEENCHYLRYDVAKIFIALAIFLLIDVSFYSWNYFD